MSLDTQLQSAFTAVGTAVKGKVSTSLLGVANGVATLDSAGKVPASQLPSFVDDVLEFADQASFPGTGEAGKIYFALDTSRQYRWSGSAYVQITSGGAVDSVNGMTGVVTITNISGNAGTATKLAATKNIAGVAFDGSADISIPFANLSSKPTTVSGYGITDAMTTAHSANAITGFGTSTVMDGTAAAGVSTLVSRADHVHETDTSRQARIISVGILKGAGAGSISVATAGTDYVIPSGNVATATALATARTINGVSFNGSANIEIEDRLGISIASAATITIGTAGLGDYIHITGTTGITSLGTASAAGVRRTLIFDAITTLTHNATSLICPGAANITTVAGMVIEVIAETTANWRVVSITHPNISMTELGYLDGVTSAVQTQLDAKASLASPTFTGTPSLPTGATAVTQTAGNSTTAIATTAFVTGAISTLSSSVGPTNTDYVAVFNAALV